MLNTLSIDTKTPNIRYFTLKITQFIAFYLQNTLKTRDIWCDYSKKLGSSPFYMQNLNNSNTFCGGENSEKLGFSTSVTIFAIYLWFYMWFYKGIKVNISATTQKFIVALPFTK